ncbi:MAG: ABC transporter permease, partial [Caldilineaceae bacterium]|nr:ABC transporter permease [Caldilineaceae bacterium]
PREVLLSHGLWQRRFNGDPDIIGQTLTIDGASALVVGVMPATFAFPEPGLDIWFANRFQAADRDSWTSHNHNVIARLTANADIAQASHELSALATTLAAEHPAEMTGWGVNVVSAHADAVRTVQPLLTVLAGVVGVVLLIACANLATLQLARTSRRHVEMAVRAAIGAGRGRLVRQLLTETLLITGLGGAIGLGVLAASLKVLLAAAPPNIPFIESVAINGPVLGFAVAVTLGCGLLVGLVPALLISRGTVRPLLASTRTTAGGAEIRWRHLLVAAQVGLTLVLLITSGLLVQSVWKLQSVDHGFDPSHLLTVSIDLPSARYPDNASQQAFYATLLDQLAGLSGVVSVAGTSATPATGANMTFSYAVEGRQAPNPTGREDAQPLQSITPGYFRTMGIPVLEGRGVDPSDQADAPGVIVINHALAIRHWPTGGAVGARLRFRDNLPWLTIVGVVADTHDEGLDVPSPPTIYVPFTQRPDTWRWLTWQTLMLRTVGDPLAVLPSVRTTVWEVDRDLPILEARTMNAAFAQNDARRRFAMSLSGAFAILALGLAAIGIVGVLSCAMAERRKEIGIRLALGASPTRVAS